MDSYKPSWYQKVRKRREHKNMKAGMKVHFIGTRSRRQYIQVLFHRCSALLVLLAANRPKQSTAIAFTMMFNHLARAAVRPQRVQRRTFLDWMTNYPDRVSGGGNEMQRDAFKGANGLDATEKTRIGRTATDR